QKQDEAAVHHYRLALQLAPENEMLPMRLAMALGRLRQIDEAITVLERLVKQQPEARLAQLSWPAFIRKISNPKRRKPSIRCFWSASLISSGPFSNMAACWNSKSSLLKHFSFTARESVGTPVLLQFVSNWRCFICSRTVIWRPWNSWWQFVSNFRIIDR
ncbi:MAG: tetratricopeptide repeat protein, partial [Desulfuromonadaceae bacterium]|nr:tetratricopeptide repeat protein [Desulfuromonadaceae bacterium]